MPSSSTAIREVPFFNYPQLFKDHEDEFVKIFRDVASRGAFILQKDLIEFEVSDSKITKKGFIVLDYGIYTAFKEIIDYEHFYLILFISIGSGIIFSIWHIMRK